MPPHADKPRVAITVGDFNGIGPEVTLKSIRHPSVRAVCVPMLVGPMEVFAGYARRLKMPVHFAGWAEETRLASSTITVIETGNDQPIEISPGMLSPEAGHVAAAAIQKAVHVVQSGTAHALVTAPVSKQALHLAKVDVPGQTELLQQLTGSPAVAMMLVSSTMRVCLATIHVPIRKVSEMLSRQTLRERIVTAYEALRHDWKIRSPRLAVLGLNPHAGEGGDIGTEERDVILPVVQELRKARMRIEGPCPADAFFGRYSPGMYDAVVAMYHDQGLIPLKMSSFGKGVNVTAGLTIVRTSPDHGTAFDIAGKGVADAGSMIEAIKLAAALAVHRGVFRKRKVR
ncbi:MAG: 4-hydroxythreonine-4-phosphate dehydrogenase PdxA [Ignavibacteria bacterium]